MASKRQLILDLLARDKTKQGTDSASRNLDDVAESAEDAAKATDKLGKESDKAEDQVERLGKSSRTAAQHVERLDREIESVEKELRQLAVSFAEAETAADRLDLSRAIRRTESDLKKLNKSKGMLAALVPKGADVDVAAKGFMASLGQSLTAVSGTLGGSVGPTIGGAIGIAAAPHLAGALASGLSAGAGLGVLGVGIAAAVKGSREIQEAGKAAGKQFMGGLQDEARVLQGPVLKSIDILSSAGARLNKNLGDTFEALSGKVEPFTRQVVVAGDALTGSLLKAARESGPAIDGLGDGMILLSSGVAKFVDEVADGGPEAADNIRLITGALGDMVAWTGKVIGTLSKLSAEPILTGPLLPMLKQYYKDVADESKTFASATDGLVGKVDDLSVAMDGATNSAVKQQEAMQHLNEEIKAETDPLFAFVKAQNDVRTAQDKLTDAVKKYGPESEQAGQATRDLADAAIGLQGAAAGAGVAADGKLSPALRNALVAAGLTKNEIRGVEAQLRTAKAALDRYGATDVSPRVRLDIASAAQAANQLQQRINALHGKTIPVTVRVTQQGEVLYGNQGSMLDRRAGGGPVAAGKAYLVGEKRPEVFVPGQSGTIVPSVGQYARGMSSGSGDGGGWVVIRGDAVIDGLVQLIASRVSAKGGRAAQLGIRFT